MNVNLRGGHLILLLSFLALFCSSKVLGQQKTITQRLDSLLLSEDTENSFNGTIVVGNEEEMLFQKVVCIADRVWAVPFQSDTRSRICSINKSMK